MSHIIDTNEFLHLAMWSKNANVIKHILTTYSLVDINIYHSNFLVFQCFDNTTAFYSHVKDILVYATLSLMSLPLTC